MSVEQECGLPLLPDFAVRRTAHPWRHWQRMLLPLYMETQDQPHHVLMDREPGGHAHLLSDHIFLGASLVAIFTAEAHLIAADIRRRWAVRMCRLLCWPPAAHLGQLQNVLSVECLQATYVFLESQGLHLMRMSW